MGDTHSEVTPHLSLYRCLTAFGIHGTVPYISARLILLPQVPHRAGVLVPLIHISHVILSMLPRKVPFRGSCKL